MKRIVILLCTLISHSVCAHELIENISAYHQNSKWQKSTAISLFEDFAQKQNLQGNEALLDVCSGDGKITAQMAQSIPKGQIVGIDSSLAMVQFAEQHYGKHHPLIRFENKDALTFNLNQQFDIVTSFTCMHLIAQQDEVLQKLHHSLKKDGQLLMIFPVVHGFGNALNDVTTSSKWKSYFLNFKPNWHFFTQQTYQDLLKHAGFKIERLEIDRKDESYPNREIFADAISHWLPHLKIIPPHLRSDFLNDLVNRYLKNEPLDHEGHVHFYVDNLIVQAKRT